MLLFKKKYNYYLYIFFLILVFFFNEFSTNTVLSKNYIVSDIKVEESYNINFDKSKVIDKAFNEAFKILTYKLVDNKERSKMKNISLKDKKSLIENFSIIEEKFINNKYIGQFNVQFNKKKIINYLNNKSIIPSSPNEIKIFLLPILIDTNLNEPYYLNQNIFYNNWNLNSKNYHLIKYVLPNEDIEDYYIIKNNIKNIENYNFKEITKKYNLHNEIIMIILKSNSGLRVFSKIKFGNINLISNSFYSLDSFEDEEKINNIIYDIKDNFEDRWKSVNKINQSIVLPIRLSVISSKTKFSDQLENYLSSIDLVSDFKIEIINNKEIIYKITFNGTPNKFLDIMSLYNIEIDTSKDIWKIQ
tara:strand:+ start:13344 stop:14420 length:1077 start_codon:yes stop_codon:yes gene_type:complete